MAFGSHGDTGDFYGWIMAYDAKSLQQLASYNTAPDWGQGGVWQSGTGLAADEEGYIYAVVGNGESSSSNAQKNPPILPPKNILKPVYGNCILKMQLTQAGGKASLDVVDWFTASDTMNLNDFDNDFIGGPVLFDVPPVDSSSGHLVIGGGKDGKIYLCDRNFLGSWMPVENKRILQAEKLCSFHIHGAPVVWENSKGEVVAFVWSEKDFLRALRFNGKTFDAKPQSTSAYGFPEDELRMPGGILTLSADGDRDGTAIVWASHPTDDDGMNQTVLGTLAGLRRPQPEQRALVERHGRGGCRPGRQLRQVLPTRRRQRQGLHGNLLARAGGLRPLLSNRQEAARSGLRDLSTPGGVIRRRDRSSSRALTAAPATT